MMAGIVMALFMRHSLSEEAEKLTPGLIKMAEDCDPDFCLCLPRLVWLQFLMHHAQQHDSEHVQLLHHFLPHRFLGKLMVVSIITSNSRWGGRFGFGI